MRSYSVHQSEIVSQLLLAKKERLAKQGIFHNNYLKKNENNAIWGGLNKKRRSERDLTM